MAKLAEKSANVLKFLQGNGGEATIQEIADHFGVSVRSIIPTITLTLGRETKEGRPVLANYLKKDGEVPARAVLTDAGKNYSEAAE